MPESGGTSHDRLKVFISYSRKDSEAFADELVSGLEFAGFNVTIDRHSIVEGEDWKKRLGTLISDADTVVFVVSPGSASSPICQWEVDEAVKLCKRILPVLWLPVGAIAAQEKLAALNYTRFDDGRSFMAGLKALIVALNTDLGWLREHTRLLARAVEWDQGKRAANRLLSGNDIAEAKAWAASRPSNAPELTPLHLDFIRASELAENDRFEEDKRQLEEMRAAQEAREIALASAEEAQLAREAEAKRRARLQQFLIGGATAAALVFGAFGVISYNLSIQANSAKQTAEERRMEAEQAKIMAETQSQLASAAATQAERDRDLAQEGQSIFLAELSRSSFKEGNILRSMLLSVEALPDEQRGVKRPLVREAVDLAFANYYDLATKSSGSSGSESATLMLLVHGGERLLVGYENVAEIVNLPTLSVEARLGGHIGKLTAFAAATAAPIVATGSEDNTVRVWNANEGNLIHVLRGHTGAIRNVEFDEGGKRAITASDDGTARVWDVAAGRQLAVLARNEGPVSVAKLSPDGKMALTATTTGKVWVWDLAQTEPLGFLEDESTNDIVDAEFYSNGTRVLVARSYGSPHAFDARTLKQVTIFEYSDGVKSVAFNHDQTRLAIGAAYSSETVVFDAASGRMAFALGDYSETIHDIAFSADDRFIVTGSDDNTARVWDAGNGKPIRTIKPSNDSWGTVEEVTFLRGSNTIVTRARELAVWTEGATQAYVRAHSELSSDDGVVMADNGSAMLRIAPNGAVTLWGIGADGLKQRALLRKLGGRQGTAVFSPDARLVAIGSTDDRLGIWRTDTLEEIKTFEGIAAEKVAFSKRGDQFAATTRSLTFLATDVDGNAHIEPAGSGIGGDYGISIGLISSKVGNRVAIGNGGQLLRVWDTSTAKPRLIRTLKDEENFAHAMFSDDGRHLFTQSGNQKLWLWDTIAGREAKLLSDQVSGLESPKGIPIIVGVLHDGSIQAWSRNTGEPLFAIPPPPDVDKTATVYFDFAENSPIFAVRRLGFGVVEVWNAQLGKQMSLLKTGTQSAYSVELSGDGRRAVVKNGDEQFSTWDTHGGTVLFNAGKKASWDYGSLNQSGTRLLIRRADRFELIDPLTGDKKGEIVSDTNSAVGFSNDGRMLAVQLSDGTVDLRSTEDGKILSVLREPSGQRAGLAWSDDGKRMIVTLGQGTARLFDSTTRKPIADLDAGAHAISSVGFTSDGKRALTFVREGGVAQWDAATGAKLGFIEMPQNYAEHALSPDGNRAFVMRADVQVGIYATSDWSRRCSVTGHNDAITSLSFDSDGRRLLTSSADGTAALWDTVSGKNTGKFQAGASDERSVAVTDARLSPDERLVSTVSDDGKLRLWNVDDGAVFATADMAGSKWTDIAFNASSSHLTAVGGNYSNREAIVWGIGQDGLSELFRVPDSSSVRFTPDGKGLAVFKSRSLQVLDLPTGKLRQHINLEKSSDGYGDGPFDGLLISQDSQIATSPKSGAVWTMKWSAQDIGDHLRSIVPRCLSLEEREEVHLGQEPPYWCIEMSKWPYDGPEWKRWMDEKRAGNAGAPPVLPTHGAGAQSAL